MTVLSLLGVTKLHPRARRTGRERFALREVSLEVEAGEFVAVWGKRRSGRSKLLEVCAGLDRDISGVVRFDGRDVATTRPLGARGGIGFAYPLFSPMHGVAIEQVATPMLKSQMPLEDAQERAFQMLERVGAAASAELRTDELEPAELVRVMLARALMMEPRLILLDAPAAGLSAPERTAFFALVASLARDGAAVLTTVDEVPGLLSVTDRLLSISEGRVSGDNTPKIASVVPLRRVEATR